MKMGQRYIRGDKDFNKVLREIKKRFHGKAGDSESESMIDCNKGDLKEGFVWFYSNNKDAAKLIERSRKFILEIRDHGDHGVHFKMSKEGFRSVITAFKVAR